MVRRVPPVAGGADDGGVENVGAGLDEDEVDLVATRPAGLEAVERARLSGVRMQDPEAVPEHCEHRPGGRVVLARVEVAGHHRRRLRVAGPDPLQQKRRAALARRLRQVVEVHVVEVEGRALAVLEIRPGTDPLDPVAPGGGLHDARRVGEPERVTAPHLEPCGPVKNGRVLAGLAAVSTAHADVGVAGNRLQDFLDLTVEGLLQADHIRLLLAHEREQLFAAFQPVVFAVVGRPVADVERHHRERRVLGRLCRRRLRDGEGQEQGEGDRRTVLRVAAGGPASSVDEPQDVFDGSPVVACIGRRGRHADGHQGRQLLRRLDAEQPLQGLSCDQRAAQPAPFVTEFGGRQQHVLDGCAD